MDNKLRYPTRDHVSVPISKGGHLTDDNRLIVCNKCNSGKGQMSLSEWHAHLVETSDPRATHVASVLDLQKSA
jgi:5-methylcytosine-specific restriction endonuclease McrA